MSNNSYTVLISACLLGQLVRYDAKLKKLQHPLIEEWLTEGILLPVCPEVLGGLLTPRSAAEIQVNGQIITGLGEDVTEAFESGAQQTLSIALKHGIKIAILTERSPSCGSTEIYDGSFSRNLINGQGKTTKLLRDNGILVFNQFQLEEVQKQITILNKLPR